ncbi:MAG: ferredoxin [Christensenellales bacterium]|jgi:ferredoxin|uniref:ferredoxin n=1 Tax=Butyribacter sp. TaxID=2822465 RepID=UPI002A970E26|nr:ferredoxin [Clostridium sp.]MDY5181688.1 ferredoxin [Butyribacter sp.]
MNAIVSQDVCIGCGLCTSTVEEVFRMNDDGKAEVYNTVSEETKDAVQEAIDSCPVNAIEWD